MTTYHPPYVGSSASEALRTIEIEALLKLGLTDGISLNEFLEVSFLNLMDNRETHIEQGIMYGSQHYLMHSCVENIATSVPITTLRKLV